MIETQKFGKVLSKNVSAILPKVRPLLCTHHEQFTNGVFGIISGSKQCFLKHKLYCKTRYFSVLNSSTCLLERGLTPWMKSASLQTGFHSSKKEIKRHFSSSNDGNDNPNMKTKNIYLRSPFKWFDVKVKMLLMKSFFDQEFNENEFLQGARQAICLVTKYIAEGQFQRLSGLLSDKATEDSRELCQKVSRQATLRVTDEEIDNISVSNLGFIYDEKGRKWADILVTCHCIEENPTAKKVGNVEIFAFPSQRIFSFSFVREFTPGVTADWIIDRIAFSKSFSDD